MFNRKCPRCGRKIKKEYEFCPYCGFNVKKEQEGRDFGLLGKNDELEFPDIGIRMPFGFNKLFSSLINQIDKQFRELDKEMGKEIKEEKIKEIPKFARGMSISISTGTGKKPEIKVRGFGPGFKNLATELKEPVSPLKIKPAISEQKAKKYAKLPREEAETTVRRLSNKIIYEIKLPEVKKISDVVINQLENSIEIKAFSKDKAYFKFLPIKLPILNYKLDKEKLILELKAK